MVKLTSNLKHLLTLRNPNCLPAPAKLNAVLSTTHSDAKQKKAENAWLVLAVRTLSFFPE